MAEPEFTATDVRIDSRPRSFIGAGQLRLDGRPQLPTPSGGASAGPPGRAVPSAAPGCTARGRVSAHAVVHGG
ncbi:hypothetical protein AB0E88_22700 [Streptomyces sp. NPDC028635]|uniref:hypothetical protein n=1 Tax=Streptomyces sp. NPDC028635 TaxID=3154800 RepID=UPI0033CE041A